MARPTTRHLALPPLLAVALLASSACAGHRHASDPAQPGQALPLEVAPATVERCGAAPAIGSRCAEALAALGGLAAGTQLQGGRVAEIAVERDRIVLSLSADDGQTVGVEAARPDPSPGAPPPLASTQTMSLFTRSDAPGAMTPAWQLALLQSLADALTRAPGPVPAWLAPLRDPGNPRGR